MKHADLRVRRSNSHFLLKLAGSDPRKNADLDLTTLNIAIIYNAYNFKCSFCCNYSKQICIFMKLEQYHDLRQIYDRIRIYFRFGSRSLTLARIGVKFCSRVRVSTQMSKFQECVGLFPAGSLSI